MIFGEMQFSQIGYLADNPTFKQNADGSMVANFRLITNVGWKDKGSQELKSRAEGFNYEIWGESGRVLAERIEKGDQLYVVSEPRNDQYVDGNNVKHYSVRFRVNRWQRLGKRGQDQEVGGDALQGGDIPF